MSYFGQMCRNPTLQPDENVKVALFEHRLKGINNASSDNWIAGKEKFKVSNVIERMNRFRGWRKNQSPKFYLKKKNKWPELIYFDHSTP